MKAAHDFPWKARAPILANASGAIYRVCDREPSEETPLLREEERATGRVAERICRPSIARHYRLGRAAGRLRSGECGHDPCSDDRRSILHHGEYTAASGGTLVEVACAWTRLTSGPVLGSSSETCRAAARLVGNEGKSMMLSLFSHHCRSSSTASSDTTDLDEGRAITHHAVLNPYRLRILRAHHAQPAGPAACGRLSLLRRGTETDVGVDPSTFGRLYAVLPPGERYGGIQTGHGIDVSPRGAAIVSRTDASISRPADYERILAHQADGPNRRRHRRLHGDVTSASASILISSHTRPAGEH